MIRLTSNIFIGQYVFNGVCSCEVESSWDILTAVAKIEIPRRISWEGRPLVFDKDPIIKKGDRVSLSLGYDGDNKNVYDGYITRISTNVPCILECEDEMWPLKSKVVTKSYISVSLKKLLKDILPSSVSYECYDIDLGPIRISKASVVQVLEMLRDRYFIKSFFRDKKLYCGLAYWPKLQREHKLDFSIHIVENGLEYIRKEDVKIKLKVIILNSSNKKTEYEYGDKDGEERTLHYYNISKATADKTAGQEIDRLRYEGYRGSITIFGAPMVNHGDVVRLNDDNYPERNGRYLVKSVRRAFNMSGYRQVLELDSKI